MSSMDSIKQSFFQECEDLLRELESGLIALNNGEQDGDTIDAVFRAVHSIKGGAGAFDLTSLVNFSHIFENVLDDLRSDRVEGTPDIYTTLLESSDMLHDLVESASNDAEWDEAKSAGLIATLKLLSTKDNEENAADAPEEDFGFKPMALSLDLGQGAAEPALPTLAGGIDLAAGLDLSASAPAALPPLGALSAGSKYEITFKPFAQMFGKGQSVTRLLRHLAELGDLETSCDETAVPDFESLDPEEAYLSWTITLTGDVSEDDISEVFDFVIDDCELSIKQADAEVEPAAPSAEPLQAGGLPILDLVKTDAPAQDSPLPVLKVQPLELVPEAAADEQPKEVAKAEKKKETPTASKPAASRQAPPATIRVNLERVDRLINQVGELVINQAMVTQCVADAGLVRDPSLISAIDEFKQLTRDIQESVMSIRAQPVQPLFQRMSRIVREAAQATDKKARLVMDGEFTEVDKTIVEKLADPLTHMIRNAIDHGLETPEERVAAGKPAEGIVKLSAAHRSGKIVIEVSDDGHGINRSKVKSIAVKKGLIAEDADLTDTEIDNLLFMPGFSTVDQVSTLSGRGVGMDVVKRAIQSFGGRISISSAPGKGSVFSINLPLTLAVLDGMLVEVAEQILVVPLISITETLLPRPGDIHQVTPTDSVINVRGSFIPLIDLAQKLKFPEAGVDRAASVVLCVEKEDGTKCALRVDSIQDQRQVVIKSLEDNYGHVPFIAAATILGDGQIALILDVDDLVQAPSPSLPTSDSPQTAELKYA